jgi:hypothetical protein
MLGEKDAAFADLEKAFAHRVGVEPEAGEKMRSKNGWNTVWHSSLIAVPEGLRSPWH